MKYNCKENSGKKFQTVNQIFKKTKKKKKKNKKNKKNKKQKKKKQKKCTCKTIEYREMNV